MDKMKMQSKDRTQENFEKLAALFPNAVTETITGYDEDGNAIIERAIDKDVLQQEISAVVVEGRDERYQFTWPDKKKSILAANAPIRKTLRPCREESVDFDNTENLYIEGDNLDVLKLLQETYLGKVKMIYIDPPYNTGHDAFIYDDDYEITLAEFANQSGAFDESGRKLFDLRINNESNGKFHTDWLNMIYPRLKIARDFLSDDGVFCVQIDDNEYSNMKKVCDEVFGIEQFMTTIVVKMSEPTGMKMAHTDTRLPKLKEYVLVYKKSKDSKINSIKIPKGSWDNEYKTILNNITKEEIEYIKKVRDDENRSPAACQKVDLLLSKVSYQSLSDAFRTYGLIKEEDKTTFKYDNAWRIVQTVSMTGGAKQLADEKKNTLNQVFFSIQTPQQKMYLIKGDYAEDIDKPRCKILFADDYLTVNPCDFWQDIKTTGLDNEGYVDFRNGKKPLKLIERLIVLFSNPGDIIMDFFSGSGTTGNASMDLCKQEHSTARRFILIQLPENIDEQILKVDPSTKKDLLKTIEFLDSISKPHLISEIGKERLRRAGEDLKSGDIGFRVLKLDSTNMKDVYYNPHDVQMSILDDLESNIKEDRTPEDLLFQVMLDLGVLLSSKIEECEVWSVKSGVDSTSDSEKTPHSTLNTPHYKYYSVADGFLMACFDEDIDESVIIEIAKKQPAYFVMRDSSMQNDSVATNFDQIFATYSPDTVRKVI